MKALQKYFLLALLAGAVLAGCRNDDDAPCCDPTNPECPNYDPCHDKVETTAYFTIAQALGPIGPNASVFITDDVVTGGTLKFSALPQEGAIYTWILGIDTIVGGPEITTTLGSLPNGTYPNSLIVNRAPDTLCFPLDEGTAQFIRSFIKITSCEMAILGRFRGVFNSQPNDSTEIEFALSPSPQQILPCNPSNFQGYFLVNGNMNGDTIKLNGDGTVNSMSSFKSYGAIDKPEGTAVLDVESGLIEVEYTLGGDAYLFNGRKL